MSQLEHIVFAATLSFIVVHGAKAGTRTYQCEIMQMGALEDSGKIVEQRLGREKIVGQRFSVDRDTGKITGPDFGFPWTFEDGSTSVISRGSAENYFKVFHRAPGRDGGSHTTFLQVNETTGGPRKPFLVVTGNDIYSGKCQ